MALPMSDAEIASEYRQAKKKQNQIHILAELNNTDTKTIVEILTREGCELPGNFKKKAAPELASVQEQAAALVKEHDTAPEEAARLLPDLIVIKVRLAALSAIERIAPHELEKTTDLDRLVFIGQVRALFELIHAIDIIEGNGDDN